MTGKVPRPGGPRYVVVLKTTQRLSRVLVCLLFPALLFLACAFGAGGSDGGGGGGGGGGNVSGGGVISSDESSSYTISVSQSPHGLITVSANGASSDSSLEVPRGTPVTVGVTCDEGYMPVPESVRFNNTPINGDTFTMPDRPVTVTAAFGWAYFSLPPDSREQGFVDFGDGKKIGVSPSPRQAAVCRVNLAARDHVPRYRIKTRSLDVAYADGTGAPVFFEEAQNRYYFLIEGDVAAINAEFESVYPVRVNNGDIVVRSQENGWAAAGEQIFISGRSTKLVNVTINGVPLPDEPGGTYTFTLPPNPPDDYAVDITADPQSLSGVYVVRIISYGPGAIAANPAYGAAGETITLTVMPGNGYRLKNGKPAITFVNQSIDSVPVSGGFSFQMPAGNVQVIAEFEQIPRLIINFNAPGDEIRDLTLNGNDSLSRRWGGSITVSLDSSLAAGGYTVTEWLLDGRRVGGAQNSLVFDTAALDQWTGAAVPAGTHTLTAIVSDDSIPAAYYSKSILFDIIE